MSTQPKEQVIPSINPHNADQVAFILEAVNLCLPGDYPVCTIQRNRVLSLIREYWKR